MELAEAIGTPVFSVDLLHLTKTEAVCVILREAIITGRLKPGDPIRQQNLAEILNISATPVREALHKLDALGILLYEPHQGAQVTVPNRQTIDEIFRVRGMLEGMATEEAVQHIDEDTLNKLDDLARNQMPALLKEGIASSDLTPYRMANYKFHKLIYSASSMQIIPELIDNLWARSVVEDGVFFFDSERVADAYSEHVSIVEALRTRSGKLARRILEQHGDATRRAYLRYFDHLSGEE